MQVWIWAWGNTATNRLGKSPQAVHHRDQDIGHAALFEIIEHPEPELSPLGLLDPQPQDVLAASGVDAQRQIDCLVLDRALVANL